MLGVQVKAGVQVCLAECWTLDVSVCSCVSAHQGVILPFLGDAVCICPSQGELLCWLLLEVFVLMYIWKCVSVRVHVCLCVFASQHSWCLQKETWQRDNTIRWEQSAGEGVMHIRQLVLEKAWGKKNLLERLVDRFVNHFWKPAAMVHVKLPSKHLQYFP